MTSYAFKMKVTTVQTLGAHGTLMQWKYHYWYMYLASMYLDLTIFLASLEVSITVAPQDACCVL